VGSVSGGNGGAFLLRRARQPPREVPVGSVSACSTISHDRLSTRPLRTVRVGDLDGVTLADSIARERENLGAYVVLSVTNEKVRAAVKKGGSIVSACS
jgi:hypothetical protein